MANAKTPPPGGRGPAGSQGGRSRGPQNRPEPPRSSSGRNGNMSRRPGTPFGSASERRQDSMGFGRERPMMPGMHDSMRGPEPPRRQESSRRPNVSRPAPPPMTTGRKKSGTGSLLGTLLAGMAVKNLVSELGKNNSENSETIQTSETADTGSKKKKIVVCGHCCANTIPDENGCCEYCGSPLDVEE